MDFCEGDEGFVCVGSSGKTAKVSTVLPEKHDSDTDVLFHGAETILIKHSHASEPAFSTSDVRKHPQFLTRA